MNHLDRKLHSGPVVTAQQMRQIESRLFASGMPVAALMEKVGGLIARRIQALYACDLFPGVGILVGPGHNGGDALVVARELHFRGYKVRLYQPLERCKPLTEAHAQFARSLGLGFGSLDSLESCDLIVDGLFGFGLERPLTDVLAEAVEKINGWPQPVVSIDIPSGLHTDTGAVLGVAIRATQTLCLGLWKLGLFQDPTLDWVGNAELIDFDIPWFHIAAELGAQPLVQQLAPQSVLQWLPLVRDRHTHKYRQGHALLIGSSRQYAGSLLLAGLSARASGVGMLTLAVPESLKSLYVARLPDALVVGCPETPQGAIAHLPKTLDLSRYSAIAYGPGATTESAQVLAQLLASDRPLLLDADGLNLLAAQGAATVLGQRPSITILTPHAGEFQRLFPQLAELPPTTAAQAAAQESQAIVVRKGACTAIANPQGQLALMSESSPALARGGSGDVLTGLMGGLLAQAVTHESSLWQAVQAAVGWHGQAGCFAAQNRSVLGVDAEQLALALIPALIDRLQRP